MRREGFIHENAVAALPRMFLHGKRDQIPEATFRQGVLIGEKPVIGGQPELGPALHRFGEDERAEFSRKRGGDGCREKQPHMPAIAGARAFQRGRNFKGPAGFHHRQHIYLPCFLIEIHGEKTTGLVREHRVDPSHEFLPRRVLS